MKKSIIFLLVIVIQLCAMQRKSKFIRDEDENIICYKKVNQASSVCYRRALKNKKTGEYQGFHTVCPENPGFSEELEFDTPKREFEYLEDEYKKQTSEFDQKN